MSRIEKLAAARVASRVAAGLAADRPADVAATPHPRGLALSGPRLAERWNTDPALRDVAAAVREARR